MKRASPDGMAKLMKNEITANGATKKPFAKSTFIVNQRKGQSQ